MIIYNSKIPTWVGFEDVTIWPFIFIKWTKEDCPSWLLKHAQVHLEQQIKWWIIPFYIVYCWDYCKFRLKGCNHKTAYKFSRFEVEAYKKASP